MATRVQSTIDPFFINLSLTATEMRAALAAAFAASPTDASAVEGGVLPSPDNTGLAVTSTGSLASPAVTVAPGKCVVPFVSQWGYEATLPAAVQLSLSTPPATNPRIDLVVARVYGGAETGDAFSGFYIETVDGTPAATPTAPATPTGSVTLAQVTVATSGALTITDARRYTRGPGGVRKSDNDGGRAGSWPGDLRVSQAGVLDAWLSGAWTPLASAASATSVSAWLADSVGPLPQGVGASGTCRYIRLGKLLFVRYEFYKGDPSGSVGPIYATLPAGFTSSPTGFHRLAGTLTVPPNGSLFNVLPTAWPITAAPDPTSNRIRFLVPNAYNDVRISNWVTATTADAAGTGRPQIPGGFPTLDELKFSGVIEIA